MTKQCIYLFYIFAKVAGSYTRIICLWRIFSESWADLLLIKL